MAVTTCVITGTMPADATPVSFTRTGFGTPEAAIVFMFRAYSGTNPATSAAMSVGFWDGTNQYAASIHAIDNMTAATLTSRHRYANRIAGERYWDGAAYQNLCQYTIASTTDGVTFTLTDDNTGASRYATVILFKGLTSVKLGNFAFAGSTSAIDVTDVGFKPDVVFYVNSVAADAYTTNTVDNQGCIIVFGVAHNNSADTITQHCVSFWSGNNAANTLVNTSTNDNCIGRRWTDDTTSFTEIISAFDANGFTVTPGAASSSRPFYLAMKLDDPDDAYVGIVDSKTSTGTQAYTGTGFVPKVLILASTTETAVNQSSTSPGGALMLGATDGTEQQALVIMDDDAAATSDANSRADTGNVLNLRFDNDTVDAVAAYSSFDSDGFTLNYSDGSASARKILAFALGDSAGGGGATLTVQDLAQGHSLGSPSLTEHNVLAVQGVGQAHSLDSPTLTQHHMLAVDAIAQTQFIGSPSLAQAHVLAAQDVAQSQSLGAPSLTQAHALIVQSLAQAHSLGEPALTQHNVLIVDALGQAQILGAPSLTAAGALAVDAIAQAQSLGLPSLVQHHALAVDALAQTQTLGSPSLTQAHILTPDAIAQAQTTGNVSFTIAASLAVQAIAQAQAFGSPDLTQHHVLTPDAIVQAQQLAEAALTQHGALAVDGMTQAQALDALALTQHYALIVDALLQGHEISEPGTGASYALIVEGIAQAQSLEIPGLTQHAVLAVDGLTQAQILGLVGIGGAIIGIDGGTIVCFQRLGGRIVASRLGPSIVAATLH